MSRLYAPSIHRLDREQWQMMMDGLLKMEPVLPVTTLHDPVAHASYSQRLAKWRLAIESLKAICPSPPA